MGLGLEISSQSLVVGAPLGGAVTLAEAGPCTLGLYPWGRQLCVPSSWQMGDVCLGPEQSVCAESHSTHYKHVCCEMHPEFRNSKMWKKVYLKKVNSVVFLVWRWKLDSWKTKVENWKSRGRSLSIVCQSWFFLQTCFTFFPWYSNFLCWIV